MAIFKIIPAGDIAIDENGQTSQVDGAEYARITLSVRFQFFLGEYFLDLRQGIPYFREVFVKNPDLDQLSSLFRRVVLTTPGITSFKKSRDGSEMFKLIYDPAGRVLTFEFAALHKSGEVITVKPTDQDFIVSYDRAA